MAFVAAWDKRTGKKLPYPVPESHFNIWPDILARTPQAKAQAKAHAKSTRSDAETVAAPTGKKPDTIEAPPAGDESKE